MFYLLPYFVTGSSNYGVMNKPNLFNFIISIMKNVNNEEKTHIVEMLRLHLGITVYDNFKSYVRKKFPISHEINIITQ